MLLDSCTLDFSASGLGWCSPSNARGDVTVVIALQTTCGTRKDASPLLKLSVLLTWGKHFFSYPFVVFEEFRKNLPEQVH